MSEIRLILSFSVSGRGRLMMVLGIYIRAIKRSSINCRAQNVLLTCTFPARKRCKNTFRSVTCAVGDGWSWGGGTSPTGQSPSPWVGCAGDTRLSVQTWGTAPAPRPRSRFPGTDGAMGGCDPGAGCPARGCPPCAPRQPQGTLGAGSCAWRVLIEH